MTGRSASATDLALAVRRGLALGLTRALPPDRRPQRGELEAEAQEQRAEVLEGLREPMRVRLLYVLRDLTDEDVRQYIEFAGSLDGRAHTRALHRALTHALARAAERTGTELARNLSRPGTATAPAR